MTLVHLIDVLVVGQLRCIDREWYQQLYLMLLYKCRHSVHLLRVQRTDYQVALSGSLVLKYLVDVCILGSIPSMHIDRHTQFLDTVACHQYSAIVLHHALAVAIHIVQRQHHAQSDGALAQIVGHVLVYRFRRRGLCLQCSIWYLKHRTLFQFVARSIHLGVSFQQLLDGDIIHTRNAEDSLLLLHLVQSTYILFTHLGHCHAN